MPHALSVTAPCLKPDRVHAMGITFIALGLYRGLPSPSPSLCVGLSHQPDPGSPVILPRPLCIEESSQPRTLCAGPLGPFSTVKCAPPMPSYFVLASHLASSYKLDTHSGPHLPPSNQAHSGPDIHSSACVPLMQRAGKQVKWTSLGLPGCPLSGSAETRLTQVSLSQHSLQTSPTATV